MIGNFDGWVDDIVIRNVGKAAPPDGAASLLPLGASSEGFRMRLTGTAGKTYRIQASQDGAVWQDAGLITLTHSTAEFIDSTEGTRNRFYRAAIAN